MHAPLAVGANALTAPAEAVFRAAVGRRNRAYDRGSAHVARAAMPVISVGNISVGGTGKTPVCAWVAKYLRELGRTPAVVLRGYGRDEIEVHRELDPESIVVAHAKRIEAVRRAARLGADCAVLDDGFQHRALYRDLDIVLIAAERWDARRRMLPRGPWREPVRSLDRADHVLITRKTASPEDASDVLEDLARAGVAAGFGIIHLEPGGLVPLVVSEAPRDDYPTLRGKRVVAVSTLADPAPFVAHLEALGAEVDSMAFPDHHEFSEADVRAVERRASTAAAIAVTRKEAVKLRPRWTSGLPAFVLEQSVVIETGAAELKRSIRMSVGATDE